MEEFNRLGIDTCLLGANVGYDGRHKLDRLLTETAGQYVEYVPVCPEVECGLPVPREAMHLEGDPELNLNVKCFLLSSGIRKQNHNFNSTPKASISNTFRLAFATLAFDIPKITYSPRSFS